MIVVTRITGQEFRINPDLLLRIDSTPDTILTFIDGTKLIVRESMPEVSDRINDNRALLLARAQDIQFDQAAAAAAGAEAPQASHPGFAQGQHAVAQVTPLHPQAPAPQRGI